MRYLPHTEEEVAEMLGVLGRPSLDDLFSTIPEAARLQAPLAVPEALSEPELMRHLEALAAANPAAGMLSFLGAGAYAHHVPPAVDQLLLRSEFYTSYTPYQPEVAQGTLQAIWEFQTLVSELYGLPLANASVYDGASAAAEGVLMARRLTRREGVVLSGCVHPEYRAVIRTYLRGTPEVVREVPASSTGGHDRAGLEAALDAGPQAVVVVGHPSWLGTVSDLTGVVDAAHRRGALVVAANVEPYALSVVKPPGAMGVDIAVGEGQPVACPPQYGGPGVGLFACRDDRGYLQQLPGRIAGETVDVHGERGYVLTLSTREQHIRRERATSNICTNQGLLALAFAIRASLLGKGGFVEAGRQCLSRAVYLRRAILALPGFAPAFAEAPFFNEFAVEVRGGDAFSTCRRLEAQGILAGVPLARFEPAWKGKLLIAVTERHTRQDLDRFVAALAAT